VESAGKVSAARQRLTLWNRRRVRAKLAGKHLRGKGIEIGALHQPMSVPPGAMVRYLDRLTTDQLREEYPELQAFNLVEVDIVEDGENPVSIPNQSQDFVIASHVIEHTEDPIKTIRNWLRILRPGGVIFLVVPDRRRTFDRNRPPTPVEHLLRDYRFGPEGSRMEHYREWVQELEDVEDVNARALELIEQGYRPHFHVWTPDEFRQSLADIAEAEKLPMTVVDSATNFREFMVVISKT